MSKKPVLQEMIDEIIAIKAIIGINEIKSILKGEA